MGGSSSSWISQIQHSTWAARTPVQSYTPRSCHLHRFDKSHRRQNPVQACRQSRLRMDLPCHPIRPKFRAREWAHLPHECSKMAQIPQGTIRPETSAHSGSLSLEICPEQGQLVHPNLLEPSVPRLVHVTLHHCRERARPILAAYLLSLPARCAINARFHCMRLVEPPRGEPQPLTPLAARSGSAQRPYRFIDDGDAPSSGDDGGSRTRRPLSRARAAVPTSGLQAPAVDQPIRDGHGHRAVPSAQSRGLARASPQARVLPQPTELPYADLIPHMRGEDLAMNPSGAGFVRAYAFIDDSSGDEMARRPAATSRQLPAARPTSGWIEEPINTEQNLHVQPQRGRGIMHGGENTEASQAAAGEAGHPQRITPGMRREREERERQRRRRGPRRTYAFIDDDGSDSDEAGESASVMAGLRRLSVGFSCR